MDQGECRQRWSEVGSFKEEKLGHLKLVELPTGLDFNVKEKEESRILGFWPETHCETVVPFTELSKTSSLGFQERIDSLILDISV